MIITGEMIISGFVSKVINDCADVLKDRIKNADKNRKANGQNIDTRIYQVTIDALNEFTRNKYNKQELLYDAVESILKEFINNKSANPEAVRTGLKMLISQVTNNICEDFLGTLRHEICKNENNDLYKEIIILWQEKTNENIKKSDKNQTEMLGILNDVKEDTGYIRKVCNGKEINKVEHYNRIHIENRAEEYAKKWNSNVFLNNFNERDEKKGENVKLRDIYLKEHLPHYIWGTNLKPSIDLKGLLKEYIDNKNDKANKNNKKMLLILGQPGIGKSTLITWMMANFIEKKDKILVYQFATDLKDIDWQGNDILNNILKTLSLEYGELENKTLILDGFDEIHTSSDREKILNQMYQKLKGMNCLNQFSLIITCRENYVYELYRIQCDHITLQVWDDKQIKSFCEIYGKMNKSNISPSMINKILENKEIFGIPLILYMVLALDITIGKDGSIVDVYDRIFSLDDGGIYDRCIKNLSYGEEHRISEIKQQIHQISQRIAFWIFENNSEKAYIPQSRYEEICETVASDMDGESEDIKKDFLIGNYFKLMKHCEGIGTEELYFIHRSIYEYFVAVYFFESIYRLTSKEEVAGKLGELLKDGQLSEQIREFIKYKFDTIKGHNLPDSIKKIFQIMLQAGMVYYTKERYKNSIEREMNIFSNMLQVIHLWNPAIGELDNRVVFYLQYNKLSSLMLRGIKLKGGKQI